MEEASLLKPDSPDEEHGIKCPKCHCRDLRVQNTRPLGNGIRRQRVCRHCQHSFYTFERNPSAK